MSASPWTRRRKARLRQLAEHIKSRMLHKRRPGLLPPEQVAETAIEAGRRRGTGGPLPVEDLSRLREEHRVISGIHEVYGRIYRDLGLDLVLPAGRQRMSNRVLYHTVMARIANPDSKRASVRRLERDFGVHVPLEKVCRMMDRLDDAAIAGMRERVGARTRSLFPEPIDLVLFDCTTLFFESHLRGHAAGLRLQQGRQARRGPGSSGAGGDARRPAAGLRGLPGQQLGGGQLHPDAAHDASRDGPGGDRRRRGHVRQGQPGRPRGRWAAGSLSAPGCATCRRP